MVGEEVKDPPIFLDVGLRIWFESMDRVWEFHCIPDEKDREVVSNKVEITLCYKKKGHGINKGTLTSK